MAVEWAAKQTGAFLKTYQPQPRGALCALTYRFRIEISAFLLEHDLDLWPPPFRGDLDHRGDGVFEDVAQGFLQDPAEQPLGVGGQEPVQSIGHSKG